MTEGLDLKRFFPEVYQAVAGEDRVVYVYMNDGAVRRFDVKPLIEKGGVFRCLEDERVFREKLTVIGNTVAWDLTGTRDEEQCLDLDPFDLYHSQVVPDFPM